MAAHLMETHTALRLLALEIQGEHRILAPMELAV